MTNSFAHIFVAFLAVMPVTARASGLLPWQFGMSKSEVVSFKEFAPYKDFKNGDVETFKGRFHSRKENIQFFFERGRLRRIGIYLWEGKDPKQGIAAFQRAYELMEKDYGKVVIPEMHVARKSEPIPVAVMAIGAAANADVTGQTMMLPASQPKGMQVSAKFMAYQARDGKNYAVAIFLTTRG